MRLNAKILKNVIDINSWQYTNQATVQEGQVNEIYLQLVDLDKNPSNENSSTVLSETPLRYIPQGTVIFLEITFPALRSQSTDIGAEQFSVIATQPFTDDQSIFKITLSSSQLPKSGSITGKLIIDGVDKYFLLPNAIIVDLLNIGSC